MSNKQRRIFIIGAGGFAREVWMLINDIATSHHNTFHFSGFVDAGASSTVRIGRNTFPVIPEKEFLEAPEYAGAAAVFGIGSPFILRKIADKLSEVPGKFEYPNLIHPSINAHWDSITLGKGNIFTAGCSLTIDIAIGSFNIFNLNSTVGHDASIGSFNVINPGVNISGGVKIGNANLLGTNSAVLQNISIGDESVLGGNALLTKDLCSNIVAVGIPAKAVKANNP